MPTISANVIASSVYSLSDGLARPLKTLETRRDVKATGPTASCLEEPKMAYTNTGTQPESVEKNENQILNDNHRAGDIHKHHRPIKTTINTNQIFGKGQATNTIRKK